MDDADILLAWKNEEDTRKNSIVTQDIITRENHLSWLKECLSDSNRELNIILLDEAPVGDVRLDKGNEIEISIRLDRKYRGKGLATAVIGMFPAPLIAKIVTRNLASMRVFISNGFKPYEYVQGKVAYYIFRK